MPDILSVLKSEIARIARKEIKRHTQPLKQSAVGHRREIAALKRRVHDLEGEIRRLAKGRPGAVAAAEAPPAASGLRFSAKGFASLRRRLGLSAAELGQLLGASSLSVYKWEQGKAKPRAKYLAAIAEVRGIGKREAAARLQATR